ncbi:retrovirus-related pol polyprotein from transposon TNT 1-94, partial [Tanacetum coccineum]
HMDLCGPMRVASVNGKKYILVIIDDYSQFTWVKFLRSKDEAPDFIIKFLKMIQLTAMTSEHSSSGPTLHEMTLATISSGLMPNPPPLIQFVPPSRTDWDILFQPMFDELLIPPPSVDLLAPEVIALINEVVALVPAESTKSPSSTTVDQDAPSPSNSQTTPETQPPVIPNDVEEDSHDFEVAHMGNDPSLVSQFQKSLLINLHQRISIILCDNLLRIKIALRLNPAEIEKKCKNELNEFERLNKVDDLGGILKTKAPISGSVVTVKRGCWILKSRFYLPVGQRLDGIGFFSPVVALHEMARSIPTWMSRLLFLNGNLCKSIKLADLFTKGPPLANVIELNFLSTKLGNARVLRWRLSNYQLADIFTKALARERIEFLINKLGMRSFTPETLKQLADEVDE